MHPTKVQDQLEMFPGWKQAVAEGEAEVEEVVEEAVAEAVEAVGATDKASFQNGVDISDLTRSFTNEEWQKLPEETT
jgi:hypothetical protein